jgi:hypothetical protein
VGEAMASSNALCSAIHAGYGAHITSLMMQSSPLDAHDLGRLLTGLPHLRVLHLDRAYALNSLSFLATNALAHSLEECVLSECWHEDLQPRELIHLVGLRSLRRLKLFQIKHMLLDSFSSALLQPPSVVLPRLEFFYYFHFDFGLGAGTFWEHTDDLNDDHAYDDDDDESSDDDQNDDA